MYDFVFVTHLPAFYKINLYNELAKKHKILVVFIASASKIRNNDFTQGEMMFDFHIITTGPFEDRPQIKSSLKLLKFMRSLKFKQLILGGWDLSEFWLLACTNLKKNNAMILESSVYDSQSGGLKGLIKKVFLLRICRVYCSGQLHVRLLEKLNYKGDKRITSGVGLMNKLSTRPAFDRQEKTFSGKLIFVGRLSPEKGLKHLLQFLADQPQLSLAIVGDGPQRPELQAMATDNIRFHGYVNNDQMGQMFTDYDAFILPSVSEPWGLVIEEALYFGLPVICSDRVGSSLDLVETLKTGTVFKLNDDLSLKNSMDALGKDYKSYFNSVQQLNFEKLKFKQIDSYSV